MIAIRADFALTPLFCLLLDSRLRRSLQHCLGLTVRHCDHYDHADSITVAVLLVEMITFVTGSARTFDSHEPSIRVTTLSSSMSIDACLTSPLLIALVHDHDVVCSSKSSIDQRLYSIACDGGSSCIRGNELHLNGNAVVGVECTALGSTKAGCSLQHKEETDA